MDLKIESTKLRLIQLILSINDKGALMDLEKKVHEVSDEFNGKKPDINLALKSIRSNVSLAEIDKEQNYRPVTDEAFRRDADQLAFNEPIEELLALLTN